MHLLKQSTATTIRIGPFVDEANAKDAETGLTISQADIRLSKNGGDFAQTHDSSGATHDENGWYYLQLDETDTNTLGRLIIAIHESGALPVWREFTVLKANIFDSLVAGTDYLQTDATQIEGVDATDQINTEVDSALNTAIPGSPTAGSINQRIKAVDELTEASGDGDLAAILTDTNELQTDDVPGLVSALNDPTAASVADAVWDEVATGHVDAGKAGAQLWTDVDAILADTDELQTDDIPGKISALNDPTAASVADAVWDEATSGHAAAGTTGKALTDAASAGSPPSAATIADAVWDEAATGHVDAGKAGAQLWTDVDAILADTGTDGVILADDAITAAKIAASAIGASELATDAIGAAELATDAIAAIAAAVHLAGAGAITFTYTLTSSVDSAPITDADVWVTSDEAGNNVIASGETDENGKVVFYLDAGTYYFWRQKAGWNFTNPDTETVSE